MNALFANSPMYAGRRTEFVSFRGYIWHRMDPDRSGLLTELLAGEVTFARWVQLVLDVPLLVTHRWRLAPPGAGHDVPRVPNGTGSVAGSRRGTTGTFTSPQCSRRPA